MAVAYPDDYDAEYLQRIRRVVFDLLNNDAGDDVRISPNTLALYTTNLPTGVHDTDLGQQAVDLQTGRATVLDYNAIDRGVALGVDIKAQEGVGGLGPLGGDIAIGSDLDFLGAIGDGGGINKPNILLGIDIDLGATSRNSNVVIGMDVDASGVTSLDGSVIIGKSPSLGAADLDGIVAIGDTVAVNAENGIAIGAGAVVAAGHTNSVAIGAGATTTAANQVALAGSLTGVTYIDLDTGISPSWLEGRIFYDSANGALAVYNMESEITLQVGQEAYLRCRNDNGVTLNNGTVVYVSGSDGTTPRVSPAQANAVGTSKVVGIATHDIEIGTIGFSTSFGVINGVNTSSWAPGTALYLSDSVAGGLTSTAPTFPNQTVLVGYVTIQDATNGAIFVAVSPQASGGGGTITGTIAANQVAYGTALDTIGGTNNLTWSGTQFKIDVNNASGSLLVENTSPVDHAIARFTGDKTQWLDIRNKDNNQYLEWNPNNADPTFALGRQSDQFAFQRGGSFPSSTDIFQILDGEDIWRFGSTFDINVESVTATTSTTTGALRVSGGVGIAGGLSVGGNMRIGGGPDGTYDLTIDTGSQQLLQMRRNNALGGGFQFEANNGNAQLWFTSPSYTRQAVIFLDYSTDSLYIDVNGSDDTSNAAILVDTNRDVFFRQDVNVAGKLTVTGLIDPTGLELSPVLANPGLVPENTIWLDGNDNAVTYSAAGGVGATFTGTITGATSGATATVVSDDGAGNLVVDILTGAFQVGETIQDAQVHFATLDSGGVAILRNGTTSLGGLLRTGPTGAVYTDNLNAGDLASSLGTDALDIQSSRAAAGDYAAPNRSVLIGIDSNLGKTGTPLDERAVVIGVDNNVTVPNTGDSSIVIGTGWTVPVSNTICIGRGGTLVAPAANCVMIGLAGTVGQSGGVGIGASFTATGQDCVAIGLVAQATAQRAIAIGRNAQATHTRSLALGYNATSTADDRCTIGSAGTPYDLEVTGTTAAISTSTGSGTFAGGIGVAGAGYFGGALNLGYTGTGSANANLRIDRNGVIWGFGGAAGEDLSIYRDTTEIIRFDHSDTNVEFRSAWEVEIQNTQQATSLNSGSLRVSGGVAIDKALWIGGNFNTYQSGAALDEKRWQWQNNTDGTLDLWTVDDAGTGANQVLGFERTGVTPDLMEVYPPLKILDTTAATSTTTGSLIVGGGLGIGGDTFVGDALYVNPSAQSGGDIFFSVGNNKNNSANFGGQSAITLRPSDINMPFDVGTNNYCRLRVEMTDSGPNNQLCGGFFYTKQNYGSTFPDNFGIIVFSDRSNSGAGDGANSCGIYTHGREAGDLGAAYGVWARGTGGDKAYGIYAQASGGTSENWAGYFAGNVNVDGTLTIDDSTSKGIRLAAGATNWIDFNYDPKTLGVTTGTNPDRIALNGGTIEVAAFAPNQEEEVDFCLELNHQYAQGTDISFHIHWMPTTTNTGNVEWQLTYVITRNGVAVGSETTISVVQAAGGTAWVPQIASPSDITGTTLLIGDQIHCRFFRNGGVGSDTYTGDAAVETVGFHVEVDAFGSDQKTSKAA